MANRYANLVGSNKIKDEWQKINTGFDLVQADMDEKADASDLAILQGTVTNHIGSGGNAHAEATDQQAGFMSATDKQKLDGIEEGAQVNQNAFARVNDVEASDPSDELIFEGGTGITITTNPNEKKVIFTATGTSTPGPHGSSHTEHGADPIPVATTTEGGLMSADHVQMLESHASRHAAGGPDEITPEMIGAETPAGAQAKANQAEANAKAYAEGLPTESLYRNAIINGNFDVWQRGTSFTTSSDSVYTADRWLVQHNAQLAISTVSRQSFTPGQTDVPNNPRYFMRISRTTPAASYNNVIHQPIEDVRIFAGQKATLSLYARCNKTKVFAFRLLQVFGSGGSPQTGVTSSITIGTSWQKVTVVFDIPSIVGKTIGNGSYLSFIISEPSNFEPFDLDIAQVQLCAGETALPFQPRPIDEEIELCRRYAIVMGDDTNTNVPIGSGFAVSTTVAHIHVNFGKEMRIPPSLSATAADWQLTDGATNIPLTAISVLSNRNSNKTVTLQCTVASGLTQFRPYHLIATGASKKMIFDAEL